MRDAIRLPVDIPSSNYDEGSMNGARDQLTKRALDALRRIVRTLRVSDREVERTLGITVAQLFVLQHIADVDGKRPRSIREIAVATLTDPSSVSVVVRRLADQRLIKRQTAGDDARRAEVTLTRKGRALLQRAPAAPQERLVSALDALPATTRRALCSALERVAHAMGDAEATLFFEEEAGPPRVR